MQHLIYEIVWITYNICTNTPHTNSSYRKVVCENTVKFHEIVLSVWLLCSFVVKSCLAYKKPHGCTRDGLSNCLFYGWRYEFHFVFIRISGVYESLVKLNAIKSTSSCQPNSNMSVSCASISLCPTHSTHTFIHLQQHHFSNPKSNEVNINW